MSQLVPPRAVERFRFPLLPGAAGYVYFIGHAEGDIIKIGRTTSAVGARLNELRRISPRPEALVLRATIPCGSREDMCLTEKTLHDLFARDRQHGEWFRHSTRMGIAISVVLSAWGSPNADGIPVGIGEVKQTFRDFEEAVRDWNDHVSTWYRRWRHLTEDRLPPLREHVPHSLPLAGPLPVELHPKLPRWAMVEKPGQATVSEIKQTVGRNEKDWITLAEEEAVA